MIERHLGPDGLVCSAIGFGCMGLSQGYGPTDDDESVGVVHEALDRGTTLLDTAMSYRSGHNEELIGRAIAGRRDEDGTPLDGRPEHVRRYCDASLARLGVDAVDLYYLHRVDPEVPIGETV